MRRSFASQAQMASWARHHLKRFALAACFAALALAASVSTAGASVTIGQTGLPTSSCADGADRLQPTVISGNSYVVPSTVVVGTITSWSTEAFAGAGQMLVMKVYEPLGGATYRVVGHDGPRALTESSLNTFSTSVPVKAGEILGTSTPTPSGAGCNFPVTGENYLTHTGILADGESGDFVTGTPNRRQDVSAVINPTNSFTPGAVTRNKKKGTATLAFNLPNPGDLAGSGQGAQVASTGAVTSKAVPAGIATLVVKAKGKKKRKLNEKGKVKLNLAVTYTPTGGDPSTQSVKVKLKKRL